ncbi:hypothetical protein LXL04_012770 [Taraxacum kok-saghyz]
MNAKRLPFYIAVLYILIQTAAAQNTTAGVGDRAALLAIKSMIQDDPQGVMTSWNDSTDFCRWQGVTCSSRHQRVTAMDLSSGGLVGSLSPFIGNLSFLRSIRLLNNSLSGEIPPEIGRLFRLQELRLYNNSFVGNIPATLSNCSNLQALHFGYNNLVGKIPNELGSLSMLNLLILHGNNLEGGIPRFIGNLTALETLSLGDCGLGGNIPDVFRRLSSLRRIALAGNNLIGNIPPSLYTLSVLEDLFLDNNQLTGTLPVNLGSIVLPRLQVFSVSDNQLTGLLPSSVLSSSELGVIDVARNNFSGRLVITPRDSCNFAIVSLSSNRFESGEDDEMKFIDALSICNGLGVLDLSYNQMKGVLPESLGNLSTTLYFLSVASNSFSGGLPSSVGNLSGLTSLDVSSNQLTGRIPASIGNLGNLRRLDLRNNSFSGNIPGTLGNLSLLFELHMSSNELNGSIPSSLGNCKRLIQLTLDQNNLTGDVPSQLFELSSLSITLNLGSNNLSGRIPQEIGKLQNVKDIILANNLFSGDLPTTLGSCRSLENLNVSDNFLQGSLPPSLRSLRALQNLDVSRNNFTGSIPDYLGEIPLQNLDLSYNNFEGEVSNDGVFANRSGVSLTGNSRLCGGVPELQLPNCRSTNPNKKWSTLAIILVISIVSLLICIAMVLFFMFYRRRKEIKEDDLPDSVSGETLVQVSYEMLHKATDGFSVKNFIGEGSFSTVYKGYLDKEGMNVAVKVLNLHRKGGSKSFLTECEALRNARHRNLTKVITCCSGVDFQRNEFKAIVYEFMPNGTLHQWLHGEIPQLNLLQRVCIALDVAYALDYLHNHGGKTIVHCDLKPSNILLDEDMVAHVGDFGLSKILDSEYQNRHHSSSVGVRGTIGYTPPEYGVGSKVSTSGDMYSYGILLLEMMTSKKPTDVMFQDGVGVSLHNYVKTAMDDGSIEVVDQMLLKDDIISNKEIIGETTNEMCCLLLLKIGVSCSIESPRFRMDAATVIHELHLIKDAILGNSNICHFALLFLRPNQAILELGSIPSSKQVEISVSVTRLQFSSSLMGISRLTLVLMLMSAFLPPSSPDPDDESCLTKLFESMEDPNWTKPSFQNPCSSFLSSLAGATCNNGIFIDPSFFK